LHGSIRQRLPWETNKPVKTLVCRASDKAIAAQRRCWPAGACTTSGAGYIHIDRVDVIAIGVSDRGGAQPRAWAVHAPVLLLAAGIAL
jgi:hypothetical protein